MDKEILKENAMAETYHDPFTLEEAMREIRQLRAANERLRAIERCEKDLILIHGLDYKNAATNCCAYSAHLLSKEALAAIATHKEGNQ